MRLLLLLLSCLLLPLAGPARATPQSPEILLVQGRPTALLAEPLDAALRGDQALWARFAAHLPQQTCSALWRGYVGTWEIRDEVLHLVSIQTGGCSGGRAVALSDLFPGSSGPVPATWYSGELRLEVGPRVPGPCGFSPTCPSAHDVIVVRDGRVVGRERRRLPQAASAPAR